MNTIHSQLSANTEMKHPSEISHDNEGRIEARNESETNPLRHCVKQMLDNYFRDLDGHVTGNLYDLVLDEIEYPLLETVMQYTRNNQSKAAALLGINRGTLRKKLKKYNLD